VRLSEGQPSPEPKCYLVEVNPRHHNDGAGARRPDVSRPISVGSLKRLGRDESCGQSDSPIASPSYTSSALHHTENCNCPSRAKVSRDSGRYQRPISGQVYHQDALSVRTWTGIP
jgi:hypothetical protein